MSSRNRAKYGAEAFGDFAGNLPQPFPRTMGANCLTYLKEVVESGLQCDMVGRFEAAFAREMGVKHCIGTPGMHCRAQHLGRRARPATRG